MEKTPDNNAEIQALKDKLMAIMLLETAKDYEEMDSDLVDECVDFLMELEGKERLSKEEIERRVSAIPFKDDAEDKHPNPKKKINAKRVAIAAAILAALIAIFSIVAISYGNVEDGLIGRFARYISETICGDRLVFNEIELIKSNESKRYSSAEELVRDENIAILFPTWLPEDEKTVKCWYFDDNINGKRYILQGQNLNCGIIIHLDETVSDEIKANNPMKNISDLNIYISHKELSIQGMFEHNGYVYSVSADTEENLLKIIENLKEIE